MVLTPYFNFHDIGYANLPNQIPKVAECFV